MECQPKSEEGAYEEVKTRQYLDESFFEGDGLTDNTMYEIIEEQQALQTECFLSGKEYVWQKMTMM